MFALPAFDAAVPAAAQAPLDDAARGEALRRAGRPAEAVPVLEAAARLHPQDADVRLDLGLAYAALGKFDDAERTLDEAARLSPGYADVEIARARIAYFRQDLAEAERRLGPVLAAHPENGEARELASEIARARAAGPTRWRLDAAFSHARLSHGLPADQDAVLALGRSFSEGRSVSAMVERLRRFDLSDTYGELTFAARGGYLVVGGASRPHFRPLWTVRGGLGGPSGKLSPNWTVRLDAELAWSRYPAGDVRTLAPAVTLAHGDALELSAQAINVVDERDRYQAGYALRAAWRAAPRLQVSGGWSDAPESSNGFTERVRTASAGAAFDVDGRTTLRLDGAHEHRQAYDRDELTLGVTRRF